MKSTASRAEIVKAGLRLDRLLRRGDTCFTAALKVGTEGTWVRLAVLREGPDGRRFTLDATTDVAVVLDLPVRTLRGQGHALCLASDITPQQLIESLSTLLYRLSHSLHHGVF